MNIGFPLTELVLETVLRDGLGELKAFPNKLDDLFHRFTEAHFNNQFGQNQIEKLKFWLGSNQVKLVHAFNMQATSVPCISLQIVASNEEERDQQLGNYFEIATTAKTPEQIVGLFNVVSYDPITGKVTVANTTNLSVVCPNQIFVDGALNEFKIVGNISNLSGNKYFHIEKNQAVNIAGQGRIISSIDFTAMERRMIRLREVVRIGIHVKDDIHLTKYLYYIVFYILKSRQVSLIERGVHLDNGIAGIFDRSADYQGQSIFSRYLDFHCLTEFNWDQKEVQVADCFELITRAPSPNPDSPTTEVLTTYD